MKKTHSISHLFQMIKIEHSIFALPFAYTGLTLAADGWPGFRVFFLFSLAMVSMRSFAMTFNRIADLPFDAKNPRTKMRPLVTGSISLSTAWIFLAATAFIFIASCAGLNTWCLYLSPVALFLGAFYSYTKRFTSLCHFILGTVLGLSPVAGWIAVGEPVPVTGWLFFFGVTFWVAGFDILYACQDASFDKNQGLYSMPARYGLPTALALSTMSHVCTAIFFALAGAGADLGPGWWIVWAGISTALIWQHTLISADDLKKVNLAFFTVNGFIGIALFIGVLLGRLNF